LQLIQSAPTAPPSGQQQAATKSAEDDADRLMDEEMTWAVKLGREARKHAE
jgi:hypothetical protein